MTDIFTLAEQEAKKKAIFDSMGKRGQKRILKFGYENWSPFADPKDPIDIRRDISKRTSQDLFNEFLASTGKIDHSQAYSEGVMEAILGIMNNNEKYIAIKDFSVWYNNLLVQEGYIGND
jgi:hypothetical protein